MRVLVVYDSNCGARVDRARMLGDALTRAGMRADTSADEDVDDLDAYDAVVVEGARTAGRWQPFACRFARRHAAALRNMPTWFFAGPPVEPSAARNETDPVYVRRWAPAIEMSLSEPPRGAHESGVEGRGPAIRGGVPHRCRRRRVARARF